MKTKQTPGQLALAARGFASFHAWNLANLRGQKLNARKGNRALLEALQRERTELIAPNL